MESPRLQNRFTSWDFLASFVVFFLSLSVYIYTLAPSVTLEDSGEFITAAVHFGVPHPPGYPLWTIGTWLLSNFFPYGNVAWRVNLFSALCAALANGLLALLVSHSSRWIGARLTSDLTSLTKIAFWSAIASGMILAFSDVMWSQAVIAEVYTLNALCLMATITLFYRWIRNPEERKWIYSSLFTFCLGLTNHHTLLFLAPVFLLGVWLADSDFFCEFFLGITSLALSALTILVWFSDNTDLQVITQRLAIILFVLSFLMILWKTRTFAWRPWLKGTLGALLVIWLFICWMNDWFALESGTGLFFILTTSLLIGLLINSSLRLKPIVILFSLGWIALSLYGYMRFASSTNPPMNWGYASEKGGFYHAVSRGQYGDSLTALIKGTIGPLVKYHPPQSETQAPSAENQFQYFKKIGQGIWMYYHSLEDNFSLPLVLSLFPLFIFIQRFAKRHRIWLWCLGLSYLFLAVLMIFIAPPSSIDLLSQWMMKVFHLQSHCILVVGMGYGLTCGMLYLQQKDDFNFTPWVPCLALLSLIPLQDNIATSNQRHRWFGWHYGVDMLRDLEPNAIVFGGTDPGRFIPTYTIFCEGSQNPRWKKDPTFDRSDLFIITQNALADRFYLNYIRSHYDAEKRPKTFSRFEKWLKRDQQYPQVSLNLPNDQEFAEAFNEVAEKKSRPDQDGRVELSGLDDVFSINGQIALKIFEKNKAKHTFYVEESFPISWMYAHAVPHGLIIRLNPEPLQALPAEAIQKDRAFWDHYTQFLLSNPDYLQDPPATRAFSKLRSSIGNIYLYRKLLPEAEYAYRQAYSLAPTNPETVMRLCEILLQTQRIDEARELIQKSLQVDPYQEQYKQLLKTIHEQIKLQAEEKELRATLEQSNDYYEPLVNLFRNLIRQRRVDEIDPLALQILQFPQLPSEVVQEVFQFMTHLKRYELLQKAVAYQLKQDPKSPSWYYAQANLYNLQKENKKAYTAMEQAWKINPKIVQDALPQDPLWQEHLTQVQVQKWLTSPPSVKAK